MTIQHLIYGTAWKKEHTTELVTKAWKNGFRAFDTACQPRHYREDLVGQALADIMASGVDRSEFYLQTKYTPVTGQDPNSIPYDNTQPIAIQVKESFAVSQKNLHTDYLDGLILHSPISPMAATMEAWQALEEIADAGGAKQIGISNCYDMKVFQTLYENARIKPAILQNRFYADSGYDKALREFCLRNNVTYQSFWTLTANPHLLQHPDFVTLCDEQNKTAPQVLFRYLTQRGVTPLTGTRSEQHMREDLAIFEFEMDEEALRVIDGLL